MKLHLRGTRPFVIVDQINFPEYRNSGYIKAVLLKIELAPIVFALAVVNETVWNSEKSFLYQTKA